MEFYLLETIEPLKWDEVFQFLIEAESAEAAREIAAGQSANEGISTWLNPELSTCEPLRLRGESRILIRYIVSP